MDVITINKAKKLGNNETQNTGKPEIVRLKLGEEQELQNLGVCLIEKIQNKHFDKQPQAANVSLFYNQKAGYARMRELKQQIVDAREQLIFSNIVLQHADVCPRFQFSRVEESFQNNQQTTGVAVCGLIIDKNNHVLLTKRNHEMRTYPRCWVVPGGQVDIGESFVQTLFREIKEEVGLTILFGEQKQQQQQNQEDDYEFEEEDFEQPSNIHDKGQAHIIEEENIFKRKTRLQTKLQDQKKKVDTIQISKKEEILTKGRVHLLEDPKPLMLYESCFPTDIKINYPQRSSLVIFYTLKIQESFRDVQLSQQKSEIDYSAWLPLDVLGRIIEEDSINDSAFLKQQIETGISINHNYFPIGHNCFVGKYPNQIGEGVGEAHMKALRTYFRKQNPQSNIKQ